MTVLDDSGEVGACGYWEVVGRGFRLRSDMLVYGNRLLPFAVIVASTVVDVRWWGSGDVARGGVW